MPDATVVLVWGLDWRSSRESRGYSVQTLLYGRRSVAVRSFRYACHEERMAQSDARRPATMEFGPSCRCCLSLVIDDDPLVLAGNRALLEELGCQVTTVSDAEGAKAAISSFSDKPVLVLCDLWLSNERSGIELLQRLPTLTKAPISGILISGDIRPETMQMAKAAGYVLLHKPVSPARLRAVVTQFAWKVRKMSVPGLGDEDTSG